MAKLIFVVLKEENMAIHGFELLNKRNIKELGSEAYIYKHIKTGAELLSVVNSDENKVFGITFRTPPHDSTGVAHILEHSVLCGSRKYPVKEPFVELLKSSLQTFLNAMTYPDKTCYPVASQNKADFYNLVDVYLDAVFYPRIDRLIFQQEGWHYELEDKNSPIIIKGVVYNEMKGAYSSPDSLLAKYSQESLFPDNIYRLESGGDPADIPQLTYEKFFEFHKRFYHPSNSRIYFYGDDEPEERLRLLNEYLGGFDRMDTASGIELQNKLNTPVKVTVPFVAETEEGKNPKGLVTVNWMLHESTDIESNFALQVLTYILLGMPASPLRKALIESGLGESLAGVGLENELRQMYFSVGLKGIDINDAGKIENLIIETLTGLSEKGIDHLTVEAALNSIEFALRENNTGSFPRGLSLMLRALTTWLYDADPLALVAYAEPFQIIKKQYADDPAYFSGMIDGFFLKNNHRTTVILNPNTELGNREHMLELARLEEKKKSMSEDEIGLVIEDTKKLKAMQGRPDSEENLSTIPSLSLQEIDRKNKDIPISFLMSGTRPVYYHDIFTNDILYFDVGLNLNSLPQKYLLYVMIFGRALLEMGTEKEDYVKFSQRIKSKTGGIRKGSFCSLVKDSEDTTSWLFLRGKAMMHQVDDLFDILRDILMNVRLDNKERFRQIVLESKSGLEQSVIPGGNRMINLRIRANFNKADWANEEMSGFNTILFMRKLVERIDNSWKDVLAELEEMRSILIRKENMIVNATIDEKNWHNCYERAEFLMGSIQSSGQDYPGWNPDYPKEFEGFVIPSLVNYVGKGLNLYESGYIYHGSVNVITRFLRTNYLWDRIRVQGGAYGVMCQFNRMSGILTLVSYRDPNLKNTLDVYDKASLYLKNIDISESELHRNIIGTTGEIDSYMLPDAKGYTALLRHLNANTDESRQEMREQVLGTGISDFKAFADVLDHIKVHGIIKILGSQNAFDESYTEKNKPALTKIL